MELCEVRIPTYKRPELLKRALDSLIVQDYPHWQALVMDDSPNQEAKAVVELLGDQRIAYSPNLTNLGSAGNIDRAYQSDGLVGGHYAFILEDDNWLRPNFISANMAVMKQHNVNLVLRNQEIYRQTQSETYATGKTTRGTWFSEKIYSPLELKSHLFYFETISNGGLFWRTNLGSKLQVGNQVHDAGLQEYCRALQIEEDLFFASEPLCIWSEMPDSLSLRNPVQYRTFGRGLQSIKRFLIQKYGNSIVLESTKISIEKTKQRDLELSLLDSLFVSYPFKKLSFSERLNQYVKSCIKFSAIENPLKNYEFIKN